uniref:BAR domain-containing protein n=1 Tax=Craspedostauros australis TaxID=1486917 RepID=A0A7R9ZJ89_9STRA|mmetsp:Transcript_11319/g.31325  ORF Transcript_11319/g.31325 Transcript_11319/m.31325 type:complete len:185 (+) Transcript_11319:266-820(+)
MSHGTPIHKFVGQTEDSDSLRAVNYSVQRQTRLNANDFQKEVLKFAIQWEDYVRGNVDPQIEKVTELQRVRVHYESKLPTLRATHNRLQSEGKKINPTDAQKLERNEAKLKAAFTEHETAATHLCAWLDEIVRNGMVDLLPMMLKAIELMNNRTSIEQHVQQQRLFDACEAMDDVVEDYTPQEA